MSTKRWNYYNDIDPKVCAWARELIKAGLVPDGEVDERSIADVQPDDLRGFVQCHFFCGILGWSRALQLAGWPTTRPIWTNSCPCQPFSSAGKQQGQADARHLWPEMFRLIRECRPECVIGEQVSSAIGHGWLDGVCADLEAEGYACGAIVLGAHSAGAPHIRQRLWWGGRRLADASSIRSGPRRAECAGQQREATHGRAGIRLADAASGGLGIDGGASRDARHHDQRGAAGGLGHSIHQGPQGHGRPVGEHDAQGRDAAQRHGSSASVWSDFDIIPCADGKARRIKPGLAPLAHGIPARVVRLRGYGNAIVPQVAAEFIRAFADSIEANP